MRKKWRPHEPTGASGPSFSCCRVRSSGRVAGFPRAAAEAGAPTAVLGFEPLEGVPDSAGRRRHGRAATAGGRHQGLPAAAGEGPGRGEAGLRLPGRGPGLPLAGRQEPGRLQADLRQRQEDRRRLPGHGQAAGREPGGGRELHHRHRHRRAGQRDGPPPAGPDLAGQAVRQGERHDHRTRQLRGRGGEPGRDPGRRHRNGAGRRLRRLARQARGGGREERLHHDQAGVHAGGGAEPAADARS